MVSYPQWLAAGVAVLSCLNPCCSGLWSRTPLDNSPQSTLMWVLILVVVDYGLVHNMSLRNAMAITNVLILVVVDYGLVPVAIWRSAK